MQEPILITTESQLNELVHKLSEQTVIAVDTESNGLHAYRERVCLIQFSIPDGDYLVDPLALNDLSALERIFSNPAIEKVFHAAEYDVMSLKRDYGFSFSNMFDTMAASRILGKKDVGLRLVLRDTLGVKHEKRFQRADWRIRPLSQQKLNYARMDTHYLITLRDKLTRELIEKRLFKLAREDFNRLCNVNQTNCGNNKKECWKVKGAYDLNPRQAAVLLELCKYRDRKAKRLDRPLFKVIQDYTLLAIARVVPTNFKDLERLPGMTERQISLHGGSLLKVIKKGMSAPPVYPPAAQKPNGKYQKRYDDLRSWRKNTAKELGVMSDVVLPRDVMESIADRAPANFADLKEIMKDVPWRLEKYGKQILEII